MPTQSENAAAEAKRVADERAKYADAPEILKNRADKVAATTYINPGSTDVGGYVGGGKDIHDAIQQAGKGNDVSRASNQAGLDQSLANMQGDRDSLKENSVLAQREADSRQQQGQALDIQRDAALGNAPSAAAYQTQSGMNDIAAGQAGAMGSARGLSALGGVQGAGASGVGQAAGGMAMQGGLGRSDEISKAIGMYGSSAGDMRGQDLGRVNQTNQMALAGQNLNDNWKLGNAGLAGKQGQLGVSMNQMDDAYYNASNDPAMRQLGYDQEMLGIQAGQNSDSAAAHRAAANADADRNRQLAGGAVQGGLTLVGSMGGPAGAAAGGAAGGIANSYINKIR